MNGEGDAGARTLEVMAGAVRYNQWIFDRVRGALGRRVLEIGCGTGTITQFLADRDLVVGVDVDEAAVEVARKRLRAFPNVILRQQDVSRSTDGLTGYRFDSALSVNVFEHIEDDQAAMRAVHALLPPGGTLTLLVPSHPALYADLDRLIGHHRRYTKADLAGRLTASGFKVERIRRTNPVGALGWLVTLRLLGRRRLRGVGLYDRLVPVLAGLDRLVEFPVGLSLVAVARR